MKMNTIYRIGLSISKLIVEKVDNDRGDIPRSRFIEKILKSIIKYRNQTRIRIKIKKLLVRLNIKLPLNRLT